MIWELYLCATFISFMMSFPVLIGINLWELVNFRKFHVLYLYYTPIGIMGLYLYTKYFTLPEVNHSLLTIELYNR